MSSKKLGSRTLFFHIDEVRVDCRCRTFQNTEASTNTLQEHFTCYVPVSCTLSGVIAWLDTFRLEFKCGNAGCLQAVTLPSTYIVHYEKTKPKSYSVLLHIVLRVSALLSAADGPAAIFRSDTALLWHAVNTD